MWTVPFCPTPPDWRLDWPAVEAAFPVLRSLGWTLQDPVWHAEGDVRTHTRMVAESLITDPAWRALDEAHRNIVFVGAVLHDIGKGVTTKIEDGKISSPRHTVVGQRISRRLLWENPTVDVPTFGVREAITALVRYHGLPLMFLEKPAPERAIIEASQTVRCDHLAILARADVTGRVCPDATGMLDRIGLFTELCVEQNCLDRPKPFETDHHRFIYFNGGGDYGYVPYDDSRCEAILMSGLPATGKDFWVSKNAGDRPVISLDHLRAELDIDPAGNQSEVIAAAKEQAKIYLRDGQSFIWNATNITKDLRQQLIALFANYKARVRIVYTECPMKELHRRNRKRTVPVPASVIDRMADKLELPTIVEAHGVTVAVG